MPLPLVPGLLGFLLGTGVHTEFGPDQLGDPGYNGFLIPLASIYTWKQGCVPLEATGSQVKQVGIITLLMNGRNIDYVSDISGREFGAQVG